MGGWVSVGCSEENEGVHDFEEYLVLGMGNGMTLINHPTGGILYQKEPTSFGWFPEGNKRFMTLKTMFC